MSYTSNKSSPFSSTTLVDEVVDNDHVKFVLVPYLIILSGCGRGSQFKLDQQSYVIGRCDEANIIIGDPKISRKHCTLTVVKDRVLFEDLQSTNGSYLAGERIEKHWLNLHDRVRTGDTVMRIDYKCYSEAESQQALYQAAYIDALTGILNRGAFMQRAQEEFSYCKRNNGMLSIVICDVDHFKDINDNYGHPAGDQVLMDLSSVLVKQMRKEDLLARYGGEEFIMLLRGMPGDAAAGWAERIRQIVMQYPFTYLGHAIPTTISIGICTLRMSAIDSLPALIQIADDALYLAKRNGRNRLEIAPFKASLD